MMLTHLFCYLASGSLRRREKTDSTPKQVVFDHIPIFHLY